MQSRRYPVIRCQGDFYLVTFVSMTEAHEAGSQALDVMRVVDFIVAFVPSQVEREVDELEHWQPWGSSSPSETNRRARLVPALRAVGEA